MFLGSYKYTTDDKGRITIPVPYRAALSSGAYVTQGFDRNLMVYTADTFERLADKAAALSATDPEARAIRRMVFGGANEVSLDGSGRILLPPLLRQYAGIDGDAYIVGGGQYFEVWSAADWEEVLKDVTDSEANSQRFAGLDLATG